MTDDSSEALINRAITGEDNEAVTQLHQRYYHRLVQIAQRKVKSPNAIDGEALANQALLDTLIYFQEHAQTEPVQEDSFLNMYARIASNTAMQEYRAEKAQKRGGDSKREGLEQNGPTVSGILGPDRSAMATEDLAEVQRALRATIDAMRDSDMKTVAQQYYWEGRPKDEVMAALSPGNANNSNVLSKARDAIQKQAGTLPNGEAEVLKDLHTQVSGIAKLTPELWLGFESLAKDTPPLISR